MANRTMRKELRIVTRRESTFKRITKSTFMVVIAVGTMTGAALTANQAQAQNATTPVEAGSAATSNAGNTTAAADANADIAPLSLVQVLAYALDHSPQRRAAWSAAKAAEAQIGIAKAGGGLQVGLNGSVNRQWGFGKVGSFSGGLGGGTSTSTSSQEGWRESLSVDATFPVYTGGKVKANKEMAMYNYQMAIAQAIGTEQDLVFNATLGYLDILRNKQLVDVSQADFDVAKEQHRVADVRFDAGAAARLEVLRAATNEATAEQNLVAAQNALKQSRATLNTIMGRKPQTPLRVQPLNQLALPPSLLRQISTTNPVNNANNIVSNTENNSSVVGVTNLLDGEQLAALAATNSPTLAALQAQLHASEAAVDVAKSGKKPSVGLSLSGLINNPASFLGRFLLSLGGSFAQKLFDSGLTKSQVQAAKATVEQLKGSLNAGELSVANQIEQSLLALNSAQEREITTQAAVASAQEALRAAQLGYSAGVQTSLDVSDAEAALLTAQTNAVNARFDVAASQAQLASAVGVLTEEGQSAYDESSASQAHEEAAEGVVKVKKETEKDKDGIQRWWE